MRLGIDFGTTRIIVAAADRGNYPILDFETPEGTCDWFPTLVATRGDEVRFGWDAWQAQTEAGWTVLRSVKRQLEDSGPATSLAVGDRCFPLVDLLGGLTSALYRALRERFGKDEPLEAMLGVPANANGNQRFLTIDAFHNAGFQVLGLLNEPSAAAIEYGHRQKMKGRLLVYDLGGGTFDASLVEMEEGVHTVLAADGISNFGGEDFDLALAELAAGKEGMYSLTLAEAFRLLEECRRQKEALHPHSRRIVVDLDAAQEGWGQATVAVGDFYASCRPLLEESVRVAARLAEGQDIEALYVTGGGSELPLVARVLREEFGRRVKRSEYTRSATAIGLAIQADAASGYKLREMFHRNFAVWRESDAGNRLILDPIFPRGTRLPGAGEPALTVSRIYRPVHNVGDFRYLEASYLDENLQPKGDIAVWDEIRFPFDPELAEAESLEEIPVHKSARAETQEIEELYTCNAAGAVTVTIRNLTSNYGREYRLGRWSGKAPVVRPGARRRAHKASSTSQS
ncbi:MAG TPA: Hsp70 family protein [Bryobacteraceae bacterium]|nr:Hsp70 family protein [Bryobacteraceae bacterium]